MKSIGYTWHGSLEINMAKLCALCCLLRAKVFIPRALCAAGAARNGAGKWRRCQRCDHVQKDRMKSARWSKALWGMHQGDNKRWDFTTPKIPIHYWDACYHQAGGRTTFIAQFTLPVFTHLIRLVMFHQVTRKRRFSVSRGTSQLMRYLKTTSWVASERTMA